MGAPPRVLAALAVLAFLAPVAGAPEGPDFAVLEAWLEPDDPAEGAGVVFHARVTNLGAAGHTWLGFIVDEDEGAPAPFVTLGSGEVKEVTSTWTVTGQGPRTLRAFLDPAMTVQEPDEANNVREVPFVVRAPDLTVADVAVLPPGPLEPWAPMRVQVGTANLGTAATRLDYAVRLVACPLALPFEAFATCENIALITVPPAQAVGEPRTLRADWHVLGDVGTFNVCARVEYPAPQLVDSNDARCTQASAWAPVPRGLRLL